jgi:ABC-type lipoprotein export system ATPase subunit
MSERGARETDAVVVLEGVTRRYFRGGEEVLALDALSLTLSRGEMVALVGPSGCGKSTTLGLVAGVDRPDAGTVRVEGLLVSSAGEEVLVPYRRRKVGIVFQSFHLLAHLTVEENASLPLLLDRRRDPERVRTLLSRVGLDHRRHHYPSELSGGERQRTALARAIVHRPAVLLADEPTGNLDSHAGAEVLSLIDELRREEGTAVLLATHSREIAAGADRILSLKDGRLVKAPVEAVR